MVARDAHLALTGHAHAVDVARMGGPGRVPLRAAEHIEAALEVIGILAPGQRSAAIGLHGQRGAGRGRDPAAGDLRHHIAGKGQRLAQRRCPLLARKRRIDGIGVGIVAPQGTVHRQQGAYALAPEEARAVHVGIDLAAVARLRLRRDYQRRGARLRAGGHFEARVHAAQIVDEEHHALDIAHSQDASRHEALQVGLDDLAAHGDAVVPAQFHAIEPAFEHANAHDALVRRLFGYVRIPQVVAELALQEAGDFGGGIDQVLVASMRAHVRRRQARQRFAQFGGRTRIDDVSLHIDAEFALRLAQFARNAFGAGRRRQHIGRRCRDGRRRRQLRRGRHDGRCAHDRRTRGLRVHVRGHCHGAGRNQHATGEPARCLHPSSPGDCGRIVSTPDRCRLRFLVDAPLASRGIVCNVHCLVEKPSACFESGGFQRRASLRHFGLAVGGRLRKRRSESAPSARGEQ